MAKEKKGKVGKAGQAYSEDNIKVLFGLDKVRKNASMYMGDLGAPMIYRMVKEAVDNFTDEYQAGRNNAGIVSFSLKQNRYVIADFAQGIPVGIKTLEDGKKLSTLTIVLTELHAGGKFDDKAYKTSGGTHGVGVSAVNAISEKFNAYTHREGQWYCQKFECGRATTDVKKIKGSVIASEFPWLSKHVKKLGTVIEFYPDQSIVSVDASRTKSAKNLTKAELDWKFAGIWLRNVAMLNKGLSITYHDIDKNKQKTFLNKLGLMALVDKEIEECELTPINKKAKFELVKDNLIIAFQWTNHSDTDKFYSFVNSSPTIDHGTHVKGFRDALMDAIKPYFPKKKMKEFKADDLWIGCICYFNWKMNSAAFSGQVKDKLVSKVDKDVYDLTLKPLTEFFKQNKSLAKHIIKTAETAGSARVELQKIMKAMTETKKGSRNMLPTSLFEAPSCKAEEREMYIVEGDSAGGSAKDARNFNQEVLKLSGKIPNAISTPLHKLLANQRIQDIIVAMGADPKSLDVKAENPTFDCSNLRVARVMLLSDADPDGAHINSLLIALYWRLFPDFIRQGRLYAVDAPLYNASYKGKQYGGATAEECLAAMAVDKVPRNEMFRAKGWGEVPYQLLSPIAFHVETRKLIRINIEDDKAKIGFYRAFVSKDASARRKILGIAS